LAAQTHLFVATPCYGGLVTQRYMQSICSLLDYGNQNGIAVSVELLGYDSLITRGRNTLVTTFLDTPTATHLMFIDADIGFTPDQVGRMIALNEPVSAGSYPLKIIHYDQAVIDRNQAGEGLDTAQLRYVGAPCLGDEAETRDGFVTADFAGTGFMLIQRAALTQMMSAYPETRFTASHNRATPNLSPNQYALFDCIIEKETGHYLSEDYTFCKRWRAIGGKVWLDTQSKLMHIGPHEFVGDAGARLRNNAHG
jgi:hypothetical protein